MDELVCYRGDRLGGRLLNLLVAWNFARRHKLRLKVVWTDLSMPVIDYTDSRYDLGNLFDLEATAAQSQDIAFAGPEEIAHYRTYIARDARKIRTSLRKTRYVCRDLKDLESRGHYLFGGWRPLRRPGWTAWGVKRACRRLFSELRLTARVEAALATLDVGGKTAIHIRRGDLFAYGLKAIECAQAGDKSQAHNNFINLYEKSIPLQTYIAAMDRRRWWEFGKRRYLLFSDSPDVGEKLKALMPELDIEVFRDDPSLAPIQQAFVAVVAMSRCRRIIGGGSVFTRLAAIIGNKPFTHLGRRLTKQAYVAMIADEIIPAVADEDKRADYLKSLPILAEMVT
ncbi:hypothetical protein ACFSM5_02305 [Lacibacterium aquatile]|uniref:Uncharacterized protein n=1 Tax=Lacibacterium aquatile TaxID=1168082 RepID=A0ABW5DL43_9PROT